MLADKYDVFLIDLDGVVYIGNQILPGSKEGIEKLRKLGKKVYFLTNDPRFLRQEICARLSLLGIEACPEDCISSGWATADYLAQHNIGSVYVIGTESLKTEIRNQGIKVIEHGQCRAVIVGYDDDTVFRQIQQAVRYIEKGAQFIATNDDGSFPGSTGYCVATGAIVKAIQMASRQRPIIIGKPYPHIFSAALKNIDRTARIVMIGDNPDIDILGAHQFGLAALLVSEEKYCCPSKRDYRNPDTVIPNLAALFTPNINPKDWVNPGFRWPDSVEPGVAGVVFNELGQVLLVKRQDNGLWGLPSGHVEPGETVEEAVIRELQEETGLKITVQKLIAIYSDPMSQVFPYPSGKTTHFITLCFHCIVTGGELKADNYEIGDVAFFNVNKLPYDILTMHPQWLSDALSNKEIPFVR